MSTEETTMQPDVDIQKQDSDEVVNHNIQSSEPIAKTVAGQEQDNNTPEAIEDLSVNPKNNDPVTGVIADDVDIKESENTPEQSNVADGSSPENFQGEINFGDPKTSKLFIAAITNIQKLRKESKFLAAENKQLREQTQYLSRELESVQERLSKVEEMSKSEFDELIQETLKQDAQSLDEDEQECQSFIDQAKLWQSKTETLCTSVLFAICRCSDRIKQCDELMERFKTETPPLYKGLQSRYESLQLSNRMLDRLREPLELLSKSSLPPEHLFRLRMSDLVELLRSQQIDEAEAKKILAKKLKEAGDARYKSIREWRDSSEKLQKQWLHFIEKKLLPALDGINDGKPYAEHLVIDLKDGYQAPSYQEQLSNWLQTYSDLEDILLQALNSLDVTVMQAEVGQPVDYSRHEPLGAEPDPTLQNEHIKDVTRKGYEYKIAEKSLLLRNAVVVVVKNK